MMGNSVSRSSCLGDRSRKSERFLKECCMKKESLLDIQSVRNNVEAGVGAQDKGQKELNAPPSRSPACDPLPKQNNADANVPKPPPQSANPQPNPDPLSSVWTPNRGALQRASGGSWSWKPLASREVTEVTEVTETIVTEIVEVTKYPSGDTSGEPIITRTVKVLTDCGGELAEVQSSRAAQTESYYRPGQWDAYGKTHALALPDLPETLETVLSWVSEMEELTEAQKPPSSEAKVVEAQLQEQKLLQRLLQERRPRIERVLLGKRSPSQPLPIESGQQKEPRTPISELQHRWDTLLQGAEERHRQLERITPAAQNFQESLDAFCDWLSTTERRLAELWRTNRSMNQIKDSHLEIQDLCREIQSKPGDLEKVLEKGQVILELVSGEESQLCQEKMDALRVRYIIVAQSAGDMLRRTEQTLQATQRLLPSQEDLSLWLGRMEALTAGTDHQPISTSDTEKLERVVLEELSHIEEAELRLQELSGATLDVETLQTHLRSHKVLAVEVLQHCGITERLLSIADTLLLLCPELTQQRLQAPLESLKEKSPRMAAQVSSPPPGLQHTLALIGQFSEAEEELLPWIEETEADLSQHLPGSTISGDFREQQQRVQALREVVAEHKPLVTKLHRVSCKLCELCPEEGAVFQQRFEAAEKRFCSIREAVRKAAAVLEETLPRYSQVSEKIEMMSESLARLRERMESSAVVRGEPPRIREQIQESEQVRAELEKLGVALESITTQASELESLLPAEAAEAQGMRQRVEAVLAEWKQLCSRAEEHNGWLSGLLLLAERFWHSLSDLALTLGDTQQMVLDTEQPGADPDCIRTRLDAMQALREDIDGLQQELDALGSLGVELMSSCGDMDKPEVTKSLDELYAAWNSLSKLWGERNTHLEEQLKVTLRYQDTTQKLQDWLVLAESRLSEEFLVGGDLDMVRRQLSDLKEFKRELYQHRVELESRLGHQNLERAEESPLSDLRERWERLEEETVTRQHQLEDALLGLGQFQNQLEELLNWLSHTAEQLQGPRLACTDLQSCEIELAKHKVLRNDVVSHTRTVESVDDAGRMILLSAHSEGSEALQARLDELAQRWEFVRSETERRQLELENDLSRVQDVTLEVSDLLQWLEQVEAPLSFCKPVWGHPESIRDALNQHLDLCKEMESKQHTYNSVRDRLQRLLASNPQPRGSSAEHKLRLLEQRWESAHIKVQERKVCLSDGLAVITEFHSSLQEVSQCITQAEGRLHTAGPPSIILETVTNQIQEHKGVVQEIGLYEEKLVALESVCSRLRDVSGKQEGDMTQALVQSARERLGKVQERAAERGRSLEESRRQAKQYSESRRMLLEWLHEADRSLDNQQIDTSVSQEHIKQQLSQHKDFQKVLRSRRPVYEATLRSGRALRERIRLPEDRQRLDESLGQLRERWEHVCNKSTERQQKLEESLLFSGKFTDALQALMDWLYRAEPQLSEETPLGGDRDLVSDLLDKHKAFQKELGKRASSMKTLKHSIRDLSRGGGADSHWLQRQMEELGQRWDAVCQLSVTKQARLEAALQQASEFQSLVSSFLQSLSDAERNLKYGVIPEEEPALHECQRQQQELMSTLQCQKMALECIMSLGQEILSACHPDSIISLRSWLSISKTRYQEVVSWAQQQGERILAQIQSLATEREEVARLMDWITAAEEALSLRDQEALPEDMEALEEIISQHTVFMEELSRTEPEVEKITRSCKRKTPDPRPSTAARRTVAKRQSCVKSPQAGPLAPFLELAPHTPHTPHMAQLLHRWQQLWFLALDRQCRLQNAQQRLHELQEFAHFDFAVWRKRYMQWIGQMKSRILDVFRGIDRDQDGRISQREFMDSVLSSRFPTNSLEMTAVANIFDINGDGFIDYYEFVSALHPSRDPLRRTADTDHIQDEVNRQVAQCNCAKRFQVEQISANRYRFGESQQLRMVRILRSSLMVRVGGGWIALDEFLVKNDPCRVKGRTNLKINEKYLSSDFPSSAGSKALSPSRTPYSSVSAPNSPQTRKAVLRRTRSGDRSQRSRSSLITDTMELKFSSADDGTNSTSTDKTDTPPT